MVPPRIAPVISVRVHTHVRSPYPRDDVVVFGQPCANRFVVRFGDDHGNQRGGIPIPHSRIRQILSQRFRKIHRQRQRRLVQYGRGASLARPQHPFGDQTPPDPLVVVRRGRHQSGDRRTSIEDLNLTATTHHAQIAGEIRLQVGNGCGSHRDRHGLQSGTKQVSNRIPTMPPPADGLETGEVGLTDPFARADANRDNMRAATEGVEITRREEGNCRTVATRQGKRRCRAGPTVPASSRLRMPTKPGGVYNATVRGTGEMAEEA